MASYREKVEENYKAGTFRFGHLDNISLVGTVAEESGGYIPDVIDMLEENPFLRLVSKTMSTLFFSCMSRGSTAKSSDDFTCRLIFGLIIHLDFWVVWHK